MTVWRTDKEKDTKLSRALMIPMSWILPQGRSSIYLLHLDLKVGADGSIKTVFYQQALNSPPTTSAEQ